MATTVVQTEEDSSKNVDKQVRGSCLQLNAWFRYAA